MRSARHLVSPICLSFLLLGVVPASAQSPGGQPTAFPAGGVADVLRARIGKPVSLLLRSGKEYGGTVGEVRDHAVLLRNLTGREFYDALVALDEVAAVELRNR